MSHNLILYGTQGCHLCDQAESIVHPLALAYRLDMVMVDIAGDESLESRYAIQIPVLTIGAHELPWPFGPAAVEQFFVRAVTACHA